MSPRFSAAAGTLKSPSTPALGSAPRRRGRKMLTRLTLAAGLALLLVTAPAHPWGAFRGVAGLKVTDTHQQILKAAYTLLCNDPAIRPGNGIPTARGQALTIFQILEHEGVDASLSMAPVGPGPDAEGSTLYSTHWFNPSTGKGLGPQATAEWYQRFIQAVLGIAGSDQDACKGLAWSAHYLADMFVPYHLNGMPAGEALARLNARNFVIGPVEAGPAFLIDPVPPAPQREASLFSDQYGQIRQAVSSWWRQGWGVDSNFQGPYTIFAAHFQAAQREDGGNHLDWFDPWYWNGLSSESGNLTDIGRSLFSSHASYESAAHERFVAGGGYVPSPDHPTPYDPLWRNAAPDFSFSGSPWQAQAWQVHDFASRVAARTLQNAELIWRQPEIAIRASIEAVYTMWRSAFSALKPAVTVGLDQSRPDAGLIVQLDLRNAAPEDCRDIRLRISVGKSWGQFVSQNVIPLDETFAAYGRTQRVWFVQVDPREDWAVFVEAVGAYARTPDLQYAAAVTEWRPDPRQEPPRPVEVAVFSDFVGRFQITDPKRSSQQYHGEMTLNLDGTIRSVEHIAGIKETITGTGTWKFDPASLTITIEAKDGGRFSGPVKGNTSDFTINGRFSNGQSGSLRFQRR
jgi:hypothetical protein